MELKCQWQRLDTNPAKINESHSMKLPRDEGPLDS